MTKTEKVDESNMDWANHLEFTNCIADIAASSAQVRLLATLMDMVDADNRLVILNQVSLAKELGVGVKALKTVLKKLGESELAIKKQTGLYLINPFIFIGKRTRSNQAREQLQLEWRELIREYNTTS